MRLKFRYEFDEFDGAMRRLKRGLFGTMTAAAVLVAVLTVGWAGFAVSVSPRHLLGWAIGAAGIMIAMTLLRLPRSLIVRAWRSHPELARERTVAVEDDGIVLTCGPVEKRMAWSELHQVMETPALLILEQADGFLHILPKRIFRDEAHLENFRELTTKAQKGS
jgi:hypothetical protein